MKKSKAVYTIVKNEKVMLPIWLNYYRGHFNLDDIYVLNHQTEDGSTDGLPCKVRNIRSEYAFDHGWLNRVVRNFQVELLHKYDKVLFVESDEIVFHKDGLGSYIDCMDVPSIKCNGYELQHITDKEDDIDLSRPILDQRSWWYPNEEYCKTLISSEPIRWGLGFHECENPGIFDPNLYLVHLHRFDRKIALKKNEDRAKMNWNKLDVERNHGFQNRILGEEFDRWFEAYRGWDVLRPIDPSVKDSRAF